MRRLLLRVIIGSVTALALGAGGWWSWQLYRHDRQTIRQLEETTATLAKRQETLTMVEDERQKLSQAYDELKERWTKTDNELQQLTQTSAQQAKELVVLSRERADLQRQLAEAKRQRTLLEAQVGALKQNVAAAETANAVLEAQLKETMHRSLTRAEVEQLAMIIAQRQQDEQHLQTQVLELSHAYEALATSTEDLRTQVAQQPARKGSSRTAAPSRAASPGLDFRRSARLYRDLGEAHLAMRQYDKAASAFEESLRWQDDPDIHARLEFIYTRLLPNQEKAVYHAARAPTGETELTPLDSIASVHGYPRDDRRLVWQWLTD